MRTIAPAAVAAVSLLAAAAAGPPPDDTKPAAMRACGVHEAAALSPTEIRVVLGAASTPAAGAAEAWRILSDTDPAYAWTSFVVSGVFAPSRTEP
ncbi:MAG: hypothetical protein IJV65_04460 [Kiritimatiellae bacterium]|nr:hypothetical protein [Kiritimatiellia bacterium]